MKDTFGPQIESQRMEISRLISELKGPDPMLEGTQKLLQLTKD